jgi:hypothetical protein
MSKYTEYLSYLLRHKYYVAQELVSRGYYVLAITHDLNKMKPSQIRRYANFFYGKKVRNSTGYYKPTDTGDMDFEWAWFDHQANSKHHWQYWCVPTETGALKIMEMPEKYVVEMFCDWRGAGKAQGTPDTQAWYNDNGDKLHLHENTRARIEELLEELND